MQRGEDHAASASVVRANSCTHMRSPRARCGPLQRLVVQWQWQHRDRDHHDSPGHGPVNSTYSQASPQASPSVFFWLALGTVGQLSFLPVPVHRNSKANFSVTRLVGSTILAPAPVCMTCNRAAGTAGVGGRGPGRQALEPWRFQNLKCTMIMMHATAWDSLIQHPISVLVSTTGCVRDRNMHRCQAREGDEKGRPSHWCRWTSFCCESAWNNAMGSGGETETESQRCAGFE